MSMTSKFIFLLPVFFVIQFTEVFCQTDKKPNIIFILADDLGWTDVNTFDPKHRDYYETPNIDKLAKQGIKFNQAYSNAANCSPTRAALISGQYYPHQPIYHVGNPSQGKMIPAPNVHSLPVEKFTIAEALKNAGYKTGFIGKWHIGDPPDTGPLQHGFDLNVGGYNAGNPGKWEGQYFQPNNNPYIHDAKKGEYLTDYLTRKAIDFIEDQQSGPFYLQLSYYTPHSPHQAPDLLVQKYQNKKGMGGHNNPVYAAMIESLDSGVGELMDILDDLGIAENTIFIFSSDNGGEGGYGFLGHEENNVTDNSPLKGGKTTYYEGGIRVPLIIRWPALIKPDTQCEAPVLSIDFYPTFLDAAGIGKPENYLLDGLSLLPLFENPGTNLNRQTLYWHFPGYPNVRWRTGPVSVIRSGPYKLMKFYETNHVELYNLNQDIGEQHDLVNVQPKICKKLKNELENWLEQNGAPMPKKR
jgi:arylsulfatase A-like enzyme